MKARENPSPRAALRPTRALLLVSVALGTACVGDLGLGDRNFACAADDECGPGCRCDLERATEDYEGVCVCDGAPQGDDANGHDSEVAGAWDAGPDSADVADATDAADSNEGADCATLCGHATGCFPSLDIDECLEGCEAFGAPPPASCAACLDEDCEACLGLRECLIDACSFPSEALDPKDCAEGPHLNCLAGCFNRECLGVYEFCSEEHGYCEEVPCDDDADCCFLARCDDPVFPVSSPYFYCDDDRCRRDKDLLHTEACPQ